MEPIPSIYADSGPVGKARSTGLVILVTIVTFGIWALVWSYQNGDEISAYKKGQGISGVLYLILTLVFAAATMFLMADEIGKLYQAEDEPAPVTALTGLWVLLPLIGPIIWYVKVQGALNRFWIVRGAAPASGL